MRCDMYIDCRHYAHTGGIDTPDVADWTWMYSRALRGMVNCPVTDRLTPHARATRLLRHDGRR